MLSLERADLPTTYRVSPVAIGTTEHNEAALGPAKVPRIVLILRRRPVAAPCSYSHEHFTRCKAASRYTCANGLEGTQRPSTRSEANSGIYDVPSQIHNPVHVDLATPI